MSVKSCSLRVLSVALLSSPLLLCRPGVAQTADDTELKQVVIFGRHNVRAPVAPSDDLNRFSVQQYPDFGVGAGVLTPNGEKLETILGGYYRQWLTKEGLLTGNDIVDAKFAFFHANAIQRTVDTAQHLWDGLLPGAPAEVSYLTPATASDPLFDPVGAGVAQLDSQKAVAAVQGRLGKNPSSLAIAYASEIALTRSVLLGYPAGETPAPLPPANVIDVTDFSANPIAITVGTGGEPVDVDGLMTVGTAVDPFVMEYADGLVVGWGRLTADGVIQTSRIYNMILDLQFRTPYLSRVQSSNVASHIVRSMVQSATGNPLTGSLGTPSTKIVALIASDVDVCGLAGLFQIDWLLPQYPPNFCAPGGALVFELRQSQSTGEYIVRASYIAQTLDQLRNQNTLTLNAPPAIAPVFIPNCSIDNATFDCRLGRFVHLASELIDPHSTDFLNSPATGVESSLIRVLPTRVSNR